MNIPKIFHFIWLGDKPLPEYFTENMAGWQALHPDWTVQICREAPVHPLLSRVKSFAAQSDILRLLILRQHGGVYLDGDMEPRKNIEELLPPTVECFVGWEVDGERINNAVIGAIPNHSSIIAALANLPGHLAKLEGTDRERDAAHLTGPHYLNSIWRDDPRVQKFPRSVFYPYDWCEPWRANELHASAYAVHRWAASWIGEVAPPKNAINRKVLVVLPFVWQMQPRWALMAQSVSGFHPREDVICADDLAGFDRVIFVPADHVLDRDCVEMHASLPADVIGSGRHRNLSIDRTFRVDPDQPFPFNVFKLAARPARARAGLGEVVSLPLPLPAGCIEDGDAVILRAELERICEAAKRRGFVVVPVLTTLSTKLCRHLVEHPAK